MRNILMILSLFVTGGLLAQNDTIIVDQIVARVGDEIILQSEIEAEYFQWLAQGNSASRNAKCKILEDQLIQKLLINQAKIDSIVVSDDELEMQLNARISMFEQQLGGVDELEKYLNKNIFDIKKDLAKVLRNQMIAEQAKNKITEDVNLTPSDITKYYNAINKDSLPLVDISYEIKQISIYPKMTESEELTTLNKVEEIRSKIVSGKRKFESMARMYSEDPMSAKNGGELGFFGRAELDPEFAAVAFNLEKGEISNVVVSKFGYHIIQMLERKGERVNVRHILIKPIIPYETLQRAKKTIDSLRQLIVDGQEFEEIATLFSEDTETKNNGGLLLNMASRTTKFKISEIPPYIKYNILDLKEKELSKSIKTTDMAGNVVYKLFYIESIVPAHIANLQDDYELIKELATIQTKERVFSEWIQKQQKNIYISIEDMYKDCNFTYNNWIK